MDFKKGQQVTYSDGGWWDGKAIIEKIYIHKVKIVGLTYTIPIEQVRADHSKTWAEDQSKFGSAWYR